MNELVVRCLILVLMLVGVFALVQFSFFLFLHAFKIIDNYFQDRYWKQLNKMIKDEE